MTPGPPLDPGPGPAAAGAAEGGTTGGFAALMAGLLTGATTSPSPGTPTTAPPAVELEAGTEPAEGAEESSQDNGETEQALGVPGPGVVTGPTATPTPTAPQPAGAAGEPVAGTGADRGTTIGPGLAPTAAGPAAVSHRDSSAVASTRPADPTVATAGDIPPPTGQGPAGGGPGASGTAGLVATHPATGTTPTAAPAALAQPEPVTAQVVPEVTRLVSRGDGTHRVTLTLRPEALGEVRVTLTVRDGEVHVRLAAGEDARRALVEGAPELRRVLELAGATETRVVVRDLAPPAATSPTSTPGTGEQGPRDGDPTTTAGDGRRETDDHPARTRDGSTARDGVTDGAATPRPEPARLARTGVDLTM